MSGLFLDASHIEFSDKGLGDNVERVDFFLHQDIRDLQWMIWEEQVVV